MRRHELDLEVPLPKIYCAGGIGHINGELLLIQRTNGTFGYAKGHIESGETTAVTALREVKEETGWLSKIVTELGAFSRFGIEPNDKQLKGKLVEKNITMYLVDLLHRAPGVHDEIAVLVPPDLALPNMLPEEAAFLNEHLATIMAHHS